MNYYRKKILFVVLLFDIFESVDRRTLLQNSENSLAIAVPSTPPTASKHYVRWYGGRPSTTVGAISRSTRRLTSTINNHVDVFAGTFRRRTHFMDSCLKDYHLMLKAADAEMEKAIKQMPLSKWE